jgi:BirA family biotin operon repressor/biotin-[acetyl-CoA-carboxylase] ligase
VLAVLAGTALAESLSSSGAGDVTLKWPNDVLLARRKVAGLLAEAYAADGFVLLGLGLNVELDDDLPPDIRDLATDLATHLPAGDATRVCADALAAIAFACMGGLSEPIVDPDRASRWLDRSREVVVAGVRGRPAGITALGELVLDAPDGTAVRVSVGEVSDAGSR